MSGQEFNSYKSASKLGVRNVDLGSHESDGMLPSIPEHASTLLKGRTPYHQNKSQLTLNKKLSKGDGQGGGDYSSAKLLQQSPYAAGQASFRSGVKG